MANEATSNLVVYIESKAHEDLKHLAAVDRRTLGAEVAWLIAQELESRQSYPGSRGPIQAAPSSTRDSDSPAAPAPPAGQESS